MEAAAAPSQFPTSGYAAGSGSTFVSLPQEASELRDLKQEAADAHG